MCTHVDDLRIIRIHTQATGSKHPSEEWVLIINEGDEPWDVAGWILTHERTEQHDGDAFIVPATFPEGGHWRFDPGERLYLHTGSGHDTFVRGKPPQFHFYWHRTNFVWTIPGENVYLRSPDGRFATRPFAVPGDETVWVQVPAPQEQRQPVKE